MTDVHPLTKEPTGHWVRVLLTGTISGEKYHLHEDCRSGNTSFVTDLVRLEDKFQYDDPAELIKLFGLHLCGKCKQWQNQPSPGDAVLHALHESHLYPLDRHGEAGPAADLDDANGVIEELNHLGWKVVKMTKKERANEGLDW